MSQAVDTDQKIYQRPQNENDSLVNCVSMEESWMVTGGSVSTESDLKMEYSSDTNNDSDDENSDVEITFGPWPPFPSKQDTEIPDDDQMEGNLDLQDSNQSSEQCEEDFHMESNSSKVSSDEHLDLESEENYTTTDDITGQCVQADETEVVDVIGSPELVDRNEDSEFISENAIEKTSTENMEFIEHDEKKIPTDTEDETDNDIESASAVKSIGTTDMNEQTTNITNLSTECDDVISNCVSLDSGAGLCTNNSLNPDVINTQPPLETDIVIKEEPKMEGYPDSNPSEIEKDDHLFVSTEHGKMFLRTAENEGNEFEKTEKDSSADKIPLARSRPISGEKKAVKPVRLYAVKKTKVQEQEADDHNTDELMPGRILGQDVGSGTKTAAIMESGGNESAKPGTSPLNRPVLLSSTKLLPSTKTRKRKKLSRKLTGSSKKNTESLPQGAKKLTRKRKVISPPVSSSQVSGDDTMPENQVSYSLRARPVNKEVGSLTSDSGQVDLSLVKTEPEDDSEQNLGNTGTDTGLHKTVSTSWIKKEPLNENEGHGNENAMETTNIPVPVQLIRNAGITSLTQELTIGNHFITGDLNQQEASMSKLLKTPASIMVGGHPVTLQSGQKIWYTLPKGDHSAIQIGSGSNQPKFVKVIKLNSLSNTPNVVPLTGNLKLFRLQKTPTVSSCEGTEIPLSSVLNHKNVTLTSETAENAEEDREKKKVMRQKIDGIIKKNLELMKTNQLPLKKKGFNLKLNLSSDRNPVMQPKWSEEIDQNTGKTTMVLMPNVAQEKQIQNTLNKVIYRFDDRSLRGKKNRKQTATYTSPNPTTSSSRVSDFIATTNLLPLSSLMKLTETPAKKKPAMCDGFTQTKKDRQSMKKMVSGKAVMVRDSSIQTDTSSENAETAGTSSENAETAWTSSENAETAGTSSENAETAGTSSENAETVGEDVSQEKTENSSGATTTSPTQQVSTNTQDTDLFMDVEDVDSINLTWPPLDPLTVPRPMWKWTRRQTSSIGVNTGEKSRGDEEYTPVDHQYAFASSKGKKRGRPSDKAAVSERVKHRKEWLKLQKMKKSIRRRTFLKNKEWEYDCKVAMLKQKWEEKKKSSSGVSAMVKKDTPIENTDLSVGVATEQIKLEETEDPVNDGSVVKLVDRREDGKVDTVDADSSGKAKLAATEPATRSSSRIRSRQSRAIENLDMTSFFERCRMKLGDVEDIGDLESTPYITDSSDEDWQQTVKQHVRRKLRQLRKDFRNSEQSASDSDSSLSAPEKEDNDKTYTPENDDDDETYSPENDDDDEKYTPGQEKRYIKVVANPKLWKKEKSYLDVKLEDHQDKWERKLFTSTLRQERNIAVESKSYEEYRCLLCTGHHAFHTSAPELMESHLEEHLNSNFPCRECEATFDLQSLLTEHCINEHSVTCEICNQEFSSQGLYKRHVGRMHGQRSVSCFKCDEKFKTKLLFKQHLLEAHPGSAHQCDKCGVILRSHLNAMQGHMNSKNCLRRQQGNLKTQCEICGKLVSENGIRKHRQRVHQKLRIFKCDVCSYAGITLQALKDHKKTHTGEHPVKCTLCDFSCIKPYQLKCHMRTHLKLKPYKCDKCSYAASWNVQVKEHMKAHFSPTRVDCTDCNISFKDQRGLNLHRHKEHRDGAKEDKDKSSGPKKRGRPTRVTEGDVEPNDKRGTRKKKKKEEWSEEEEYTDTEAELQKESSEEEKYIPRKSSRRRVTKQLDPHFEHSSEEDEENDGHEQAADSYIPSLSKIVQ